MANPSYMGISLHVSQGDKPVNIFNFPWVFEDYQRIFHLPITFLGESLFQNFPGSTVFYGSITADQYAVIIEANLESLCIFVFSKKKKKNLLCPFVV
jgi:hypothetical protein